MTNSCYTEWCSSSMFIILNPEVCEAPLKKISSLFLPTVFHSLAMKLHTAFTCYPSVSWASNWATPFLPKQTNKQIWKTSVNRAALMKLGGGGGRRVCGRLRVPTCSLSPSNPSRRKGPPPGLSGMETFVKPGLFLEICWRLEF